MEIPTEILSQKKNFALGPRNKINPWKLKHQQLTKASIYLKFHILKLLELGRLISSRYPECIHPSHALQTFGMHK